MLSFELPSVLNDLQPGAGDSFDINQIAEAFKAESLDVRFLNAVNMTLLSTRLLLHILFHLFTSTFPEAARISTAKKIQRDMCGADEICQCICRYLKRG